MAKDETIVYMQATNQNNATMNAYRLTGLPLKLSKRYVINSPSSMLNPLPTSRVPTHPLSSAPSERRPSIMAATINKDHSSEILHIL